MPNWPTFLVGIEIVLFFSADIGNAALRLVKRFDIICGQKVASVSSKIGQLSCQLAADKLSGNLLDNFFRPLTLADINRPMSQILIF